MKRKTQKILIIIYIMCILVIAVSTTYAYFTVIKVSQVSPQVEVKSATTEVLSFNISNDIKLLANELNFKENDGNVTSNTTVTAVLEAPENSEDVLFSHKYNIKLNLNSNNFLYTTTDEKPELLLKVTNPQGSEVTEITGLEYKTINGISGFDITTLKNSINIVSGYVIETTSRVEQNWNVEVIFVNLDTNQNNNTNKSFDAKLVIDREVQ